MENINGYSFSLKTLNLVKGPKMSVRLRDLTSKGSRLDCGIITNDVYLSENCYLIELRNQLENCVIEINDYLKFGNRVDYGDNN